MISHHVCQPIGSRVEDLQREKSNKTNNTKDSINSLLTQSSTPPSSSENSQQIHDRASLEKSSSTGADYIFRLTWLISENSNKLFGSLCRNSNTDEEICLNGAPIRLL